MALTDTEIDDIAGPADYFDRRVFARAIEAASTAPLLARIAELDDLNTQLSEQLDAVNATLSAQVEQAAQPVAWMDRDVLAKMQERCRFADDAIWPVRGVISSWTPDSVKDRFVALYTAPPKAVPLTEAQWKERLGDRQLFTIMEAIRFVEKQYGITPATVEKEGE